MTRRLMLAVAVVSLVAAVPVAAKSPSLAQATARGGAVDWTLTAGAARTVLTVSQPDGTVFRKELAAGETPSFSAVDAKGQARPDGVYQWELRLVPEVSADLQKRLTAARQRGDEAAARRLQEANGLDRAQVQTGAFALRGGVFLDNDAQEGRPAAATAAAGVGVITAADQVIPDDLIVQGSGCFGFDCVNNESFGFDTIRLKENNLRIKFEDTSTGTFPTNDWQLLANDSASGGASKFSIEDVTGSKVPFTITAGASTNSIFVDSTGRVGFRTSTPVLDLHVNTSNTPALRLEQNNSGGFTAQTWDVAGNEANFFVRDVTGGSKLSFRIRPGAPTSSLDISADGDIGIGTASPGDRLDVRCDTSGKACIKVRNSNATGFSGLEAFDEAGLSSFFLGTDNANNNTRFNSLNNFPIVFFLNGVEKVRFPTSGDLIQAAGGAKLTAAGVWTNASSRTLKHDIAALSADEAKKTLDGLQPVTYEYDAQPGETYVGFIAEDVPELVASDDRKGLSPMDIVAVLTKVVQQQQSTIDQLQQRLDQIEQQQQQKP